jgi:hypothetical protein
LAVDGPYLATQVPDDAEQTQNVIVPALSWKTIRPASIVVLQLVTGDPLGLVTIGTWRVDRPVAMWRDACRLIRHTRLLL